MSLTPEQRKARDGRLTASQVAVLMSGNSQKIYNLWRLHTGDPSYEEENLDDVWAVQLGSHTEGLNLDWYARHTGVTRRGEVVVHPQHPWAACTLDGWDDLMGHPIEAKHCNAFRKLEDVIATYMAQCHWQMLCTGSSRVALSVIIGAQEPQIAIVPFNQEYANTLWERAVQFWHCVETLTPPVALEGVAAPVPVSEMIERDMTGNNAWAALAADWVENGEAAKKFDKAVDSLKELIAPNYSRAFGHGVEINRAKNGSLRIKELKQPKGRKAA